MDLPAVIGAFIMTLAFFTYGVGSVTLERFRLVGSVVLIFFSLGILFEVISILLMSVGEKVSINPLHILLGSLAFLLILINTIWVWYVYFKYGIDAPVNRSLLIYTKIAYLLWVIAYLADIVFLIWL